MIFRRPLVVRRRGAPLLRGALIGGAAYAMGRRAARVADREADQDEAIAQMQMEQAPPEQYAPPQAYGSAPPPGGDVASQLGQLVQLRQQGLLSEEEFSAAKARLLGG